MSCGRHTLGVGRKQVRREDLRRAVQLLVIAHSMQLLRAESHERVIQIEEWLVDAVMDVVDKWESGGDVGWLWQALVLAEEALID